MLRLRSVAGRLNFGEFLSSIALPLLAASAVRCSALCVPLLVWRCCWRTGAISAVCFAEEVCSVGGLSQKVYYAEMRNVEMV